MRDKDFFRRQDMLENCLDETLADGTMGDTAKIVEVIGWLAHAVLLLAQVIQERPDQV